MVLVPHWYLQYDTPLRVVVLPRFLQYLSSEVVTTVAVLLEENDPWEFQLRLLDEVENVPDMNTTLVDEDENEPSDPVIINS